jgi:O-antigen/teichoic acid export membrane protein
MKRNSLSRDVMFGLLSWLMPLGFTFVLTPGIVHGLGPESFGLYALVMGFFAYSFTFNVGRAMTKYVARYHATDQAERVGDVLSHTLIISLVAGIASAGALALSTHFLVTHILALAPGLHSSATLAFYLASVGLLLTTLSQALGAVPNAVHRLDLYALISTIVALLTICGNALLVRMGYDAPALVAWNVAVAGLSCAMYFVATRRLLPHAHLTFRVRKDLLVGIQVLANLLLLFERAWLTRILGPAAVTAYVVPMTMALYIHAFIASLTLSIFPLASEADALRDRARLRQIYTRAFKYVGVLVVFMTVTLAIGSHRILTSWMGPEFAAGSSRVLAIQAVAFGLIAAAIIPWQMADGLGRPGRNAWLVCAWLVIAIPIMIWLTPTLGAVGMAYGRLASALTIPVYALLTERAVFGHCLWGFWRPTAGWLAVAGFAAGSTQWLLLGSLPAGWFWLFATVGLSGSLYLGVLWACGYLDPDEQAWVRGCERFGSGQ